MKSYTCFLNSCGDITPHRNPLHLYCHQMIRLPSTQCSQILACSLACGPLSPIEQPCRDRWHHCHQRRRPTQGISHYVLHLWNVLNIRGSTSQGVNRVVGQAQDAPGQDMMWDVQDHFMVLHERIPQDSLREREPGGRILLPEGCQFHLVRVRQPAPPAWPSVSSPPEPGACQSYAASPPLWGPRREHWRCSRRSLLFLRDEIVIISRKAVH